jgi:hypothetical protein
MLSISMNYFLARSTSHQICGSFDSRMYLFAHHSFSFAPGASAAPHQLHHPQRNDAICFERQHHHRTEHPLPSITVRAH